MPHVYASFGRRSFLSKLPPTVEYDIHCTNRLKDRIAELNKALSDSESSGVVRVRTEEEEAAKKRPGRVQITVDVLELGPMEFEVCRRFMHFPWAV